MESRNPIPVTWKNLGDMIKNGTVQAEVMKASAVHGNPFGVRQEQDVVQSGYRGAKRVQERREEAQDGPGMSLYARGLERGDTVYDRDRKRRGTIVRELNARADDGSRRFEIVDSEGEAWKQRESRLKKK